MLLLVVVAVQAQTSRGSLAGVVTDASGAVVPGASISIVNAENAAVYNSVSTSVGMYRFTDVALGEYTVTIDAKGFKKSVTHGVLVQIGTVTSFNAALVPGSTSETVTVTTEGPTIETESSDIGGVVSTRQIVDLPLALGGVGAMRANEAFVFLQPATTGPGAANSSNGIFLSKIAGGQNYGNEVLLDGLDQQRSENGSSYDEEAPSVESIQEFRVTTSLPAAEFGRTTGGIENFATKSGTNEYHGGGYDIFRDRGLNANSYFNKGWLAYNCSGANNTAACHKQWDPVYARQADHKNDFGGTAGGPIRIPHLYNGRDKTFGFFAWEQLRYSTGGVQTSTVPTADEIGGNFSARLTNIQSGINCDGSKIYAGQIFDPSTTYLGTLNNATVECRKPFAGNIIPSGRLSQVAKALAAYYPKPNQNSQNGNFVYRATSPITNTTYSVRIDHNFSDRLKYWISYNSRQNDLYTGGTPNLPEPVSTVGWNQIFTTHFVRTGAEYSFTPNLMNSFVAGWNRSNSQNYSEAATIGKNWSQLVGLGNALSRNFPIIGTGDVQVGLGMGNNGDNIDNGVRIADSLVWMHGHHSFKFGGQFNITQYSPIAGRNENIGFGCGETGGAQGQGCGMGFASFMLGAVDNAGTNVVLKQPRWTNMYYALYAQDDFKVAHNLTLNLGMRWDVEVPRIEAHNHTSNFSPTAMDTELGIPGALVFADHCSGCNPRWANTYHTDFGPRVGFAWTPDFLHGKTVLRGGAGIIYAPLVYDDFGGGTTTGFTVNPSKRTVNGFDPAFSLDSGMPAFTPPPNEDPGFYNGGPLPGSYIKADAGRPAHVYAWNMEVQQQVAEDLLVTVGYVGNHSTNLESNLLNPNNMPQKYFSLGNALWQSANGNKAGIALPYAGFLSTWGGNPQLQAALRPFPQYDYIDQGCCLENVGMSSFDALIASVQRRWKNGMNLQISYTWGKTFTDSDSALPNSGVGVSQDMNVDNLHMEKAISAMDLPHTLVFSGLYELPFGKGKHFLTTGIASKIVGGWEVGTVERIQSGQPLSFGCEWGIPGFQNCIRFSRNPGVSLKSAVYKRGAKHINPFNKYTSAQSVDPNVSTMFNLQYDDVYHNGGSVSTVAGDPVAFIDTNNNYSRDCTSATMSNCRSAGLNQPYTFGTGIPRTTGEVRTPAYFNNDMSLLRKFAITEHTSLNIKAEFLNTFNQHTFSIPDLQPYDSGSFGMPGGTVNGPRNMQMTARITF